MLCIGALIPFKDACGFVIPVYGDRKSGRTYLCKVKDGIIEGFTPNDDSYQFIKLHKIEGLKDYKIGDQAPVAFYYTRLYRKYLYIGQEQHMKCYLFNLITQNLRGAHKNRNPEALYKASQYIGFKDIPRFILNGVLRDYYSYLRRIDMSYSQKWYVDIKDKYPKFSMKDIQMKYAYRDLTFANFIYVAQSGGSSAYSDFLPKKNKLIFTHSLVRSERRFKKQMMQIMRSKGEKDIEEIWKGLQRYMGQAMIEHITCIDKSERYSILNTLVTRTYDLVKRS